MILNLFKYTRYIKILNLSIGLLFSIHQLQAQNLGALQWVAGGGSASNYGGSTFDEGVYFMGTDSAGNVYAISEINNVAPHLDSFSLANSLGSSDILLFSYNCQGQLRWARHFGGPGQERVRGMTVDGVGNCYFSAVIGINAASPGIRKFGDTTLPGTLYTNKAICIIKVDSSGHTNWINYPGLDPSNPNTDLYRLLLDAQNNLHCLVKFNGGVNNWNGNITTTEGHIVKINSSNGQIMSVVHLKNTLKATINYLTYFQMDDFNNYYLMYRVLAPDTALIGSDTVIGYISPNDTTKTILGKWDSNGNLLWHKLHKGYASNMLSTGSSYSILGEGFKILDNNLYTVAFVRDSIGINTLFNTNLPLPLRHSYQRGRSIILKLLGDNGNVEWLNMCEHLDFGNFIPSTFNILPNNDLLVMGFGAQIGLGGHYINNSSDSIQVMAANNKISSSLLILNKQTGFIKLDTANVHGVGNNVRPRVSVSDLNGNIYFGGEYNTKLYNSAHTDSCSIWGGSRDFYIAKYGANACGCNTYKPWPKLVSSNVSSVTAIVQDVVFGSDSLVWFWGDGSSTSTRCDSASTTHVYTAGGSYNVCLRNYSACGQADSCFTINISLEASHIATAQIMVYPNPASTQVSISYPYIQQGTVTFYNLQGKQVQQSNLRNGQNTLDVSSLAKGLYTYSVVAKSGQVYNGKLVLQ